MQKSPQCVLLNPLVEAFYISGLSRSAQASVAMSSVAAPLFSLLPPIHPKWYLYRGHLGMGPLFQWSVALCWLWGQTQPLSLATTLSQRRLANQKELKWELGDLTSNSGLPSPLPAPVSSEKSISLGHSFLTYGSQ